MDRENGQQERRRQESWKIRLCLRTEILLVEHTPNLFETQFLFKMNMTIAAPESDMTIQSHSVSQKEDTPYRVELTECPGSLLRFWALSRKSFVKDKQASASNCGHTYPTGGLFYVICDLFARLSKRSLTPCGE